MPPSERRALLLILSLGLVGQGVRWLSHRPGGAPGDVQLLAALPPGSPAAHRDSIQALSRPLGPDERIDPDRASAADLARLPRVGMSLAKAIVADRESLGAFGSLDALDRVPGVGPGLLAKIGPQVRFSAPASPDRRGGTKPAGQFAGGTRVDLNTATPEELDRLPGVGPSRARAIVRFRQARGRFESVDELVQVPGFGPAALARVRDQVWVR